MSGATQATLREFPSSAYLYTSAYSNWSTPLTPPTSASSDWSAHKRPSLLANRIPPTTRLWGGSR